MPTIGPAFDPLPDDPAERAAVAATARRTAGAAQPRRDPRLQPLLRAGGADRPAGADPDRAGEEGRAVSRARGRPSLPARSSPRSPWPRSTSPPAAPPTRRPRSRTRASTGPGAIPKASQEIAQQFTLSALDGAACELGVSRETLAQALATPESRERFADRYGIGDAEAGAGDPCRPAARRRRRRRSRRAQPSLVAGTLREYLRSIPLNQAIELLKTPARCSKTPKASSAPPRNSSKASFAEGVPMPAGVDRD